MDDIVARAMHKWPNVPNVFGWLRLDRRGNWLVKARLGTFERVGNRAVIDFIGRNYLVDTQGCWYFQNGPQRVYVALDYTPWVYRLADNLDSLIAHSGVAASAIQSLLLDEAGSVLVDCSPGVGVVSDRDLAPLLDRLSEENPVLDGGEALQSLAASPGPVRLQLFGREVSLGRVESGAVPGIFGFNPGPTPPPGVPDC